MATRRDEQFDLLTATLLGVALGAGVTLLLRQGPRGQRPGATMLRVAGRGAKRAGVLGAEGARWAAERGGELWDRAGMDEVGERVRDYLDEARETISDVVEEELDDLRKAIRRQRKRLGV
ncbi:MAG TPA: hypothetical protein VFZ11_01150 [Gemmatimonadaceae bacterium]